MLQVPLVGTHQTVFLSMGRIRLVLPKGSGCHWKQSIISVKNPTMASLALSEDMGWGLAVPGLAGTVAWALPSFPEWWFLCQDEQNAAASTPLTGAIRTGDGFTFCNYTLELFYTFLQRWNFPNEIIFSNCIASLRHFTHLHIPSICHHWC